LPAMMIFKVEALLAHYSLISSLIVLVQ